jgi:hypothetical protein
MRQDHELILNYKNETNRIVQVNYLNLTHYVCVIIKKLRNETSMLRLLSIKGNRRFNASFKNNKQGELMTLMDEPCDRINKL